MFPDLVPARVDSIWERTECESVFLGSICGFRYKEPRRTCLCLWALPRTHGATAQAPQAAARGPSTLSCLARRSNVPGSPGPQTWIKDGLRELQTSSERLQTHTPDAGTQHAGFRPAASYSAHAASSRVGSVVRDPGRQTGGQREPQPRLKGLKTRSSVKEEVAGGAAGPPPSWPQRQGPSPQGLLPPPRCP